MALLQAHASLAPPKPQPGNLPVGVAPVGLVGVAAGASVDSMGLLPPQ
jgi:hypothetical protein